MKNTIRVTNHERNIFNQPINLIYPGAKLDFNKETNELIVNDCLFIHVFRSIPFMRNISDNKGWFKSNIFHL